MTTYEIDRRHPTIESWMAQDSLIDGLDSLYTATDQLISDRTRTLGSAVDETPSDASGGDLRGQQALQARLKQQMADLAAALCINMEDKIRTFKT